MSRTPFRGLFRHGNCCLKMETILSLSFVFFCMITTTHAENRQDMQAKNFWRDTGTGVSFGYFKKHEYRRLLPSGSAEVRSTQLVSGPVQCMQTCLAKSWCWSANVERHPNRDHKLRCEILSTDKYNSSSDDLKDDGEFDHYSIEVFRILLIWCSFKILSL